MNRFHNLDYLRGLAAFGIMIYHYFTWTYGVFSSESFLGKFGVYGVSIFYVLSGVTLYLVYFKQMDASLKSIRDFFIKRVFRIMPLLWLAIFLTYFLSSSLPKVNYIFFLNVTGLFGIIDCNVAIARGGWSIGNEIAFYLFFPFFVILSKRYKIGFYILSTIILIIFIWFAFYRIDANSTIQKEWAKFVNPLNQVFLFLSGYLLGYFFVKTEISHAFKLLLFFGALALFTFLPVSGDRVRLITDFNRIIFSLLCIVICFSVFKMEIKPHPIIHMLLSRLGEASYSVYMLHPIIFAFFIRVINYYSGHFGALPKSLVIIISVPCTLVMSYIIYQRFEKYFIKKGKDLSLVFSQKNQSLTFQSLPGTKDR